MPVRRYGNARMPVVIMNRQTILNPTLSTTSRLLYAVLAASLDEDLDLDHVARLAGLSDATEIRPFIAELEGVGIVDLKDHEGRGEIITVREMPLVPEQRSHPCIPCEDCGECSCEYIKGLCRACCTIRDERARAHADIARWKQQLNAGATYAIGSGGTRLHRWDCPTLSPPEARLSALEAQIPHADGGYMHWSKLPMLYTAEELRAKGTRKKHCATCGPDPL